MHQFQCAAAVLNDGRAVFNPVSCVAPDQSLQLQQFRLVDVSADDSVKPAAAGVTSDLSAKVGEMTAEGTQSPFNPTDQ
ncbi:hypothetical protein E3A20_07670 [Planctomyces bekefii]|uniref:Uncharacterized protein n=1 Tax=Planctomyces bekefii TaxID=1653850 RepID=A0A5C6M866_9PLAN|nr:hypothetical protein E3A20_07670 [Planctomyces bekefii]